jgi:uncharacterized coiled-coil DUF342 family protein
MFRLTILVIALLATSLTFTACADEDSNTETAAAPDAVSVSEKVQNQAETAIDKLDDIRSDAVEMAEEKLGDWKSKIDAVTEKKDKLNVTAQKLVEKPLDDLTSQYDNAADLVDDIKNASTLDAVNEKKVEFMKSMDSIDGAYKKISSLL